MNIIELMDRHQEEVRQFSLERDASRAQLQQSQAERMALWSKNGEVPQAFIIELIVERNDWRVEWDDDGSRWRQLNQRHDTEFKEMCAKGYLQMVADNMISEKLKAGK